MAFTSDRRRCRVTIGPMSSGIELMTPGLRADHVSFEILRRVRIEHLPSLEGRPCARPFSNHNRISRRELAGQQRTAAPRRGVP